MFTGNIMCREHIKVSLLGKLHCPHFPSSASLYIELLAKVWSLFQVVNSRARWKNQDEPLPTQSHSHCLAEKYPRWRTHSSACLHNQTYEVAVAGCSCTPANPVAPLAYHITTYTGSVPAFFLTQNLQKKGQKWSPFISDFTDPKNGIKMMFSLLTFHARQSLSKKKSFK